MWCRDCHKEVNALAEAGVMTCPLCFRALAPASGRHFEAIRHAREILERWQSSDLFERITSTGPLTSAKQQDRAPLLNIPLSQAPPRIAVISTPAVHNIACEEPGGTDCATVPKIEPKLAETRVAGVYRVPRNASSNREMDNGRVKPIEIPSPAEQTEAQLDPADRATSPQEETKPSYRESKFAANVELSETSESTASKPNPVPVPTGSGSTHAPSTFTNDFGELFAPLLATAAPPLEDEQPTILKSTGTVGAAINEPNEVQPAANSGLNIRKTEIQDPAVFDPFSTDAAQPEVFASPEKLSSTSPSIQMESASIRNDSASAPAESAETAKQSDADGTKKKQRTPLRRPPLHRRFQLDRPDPVTAPVDPTAGTEFMSRKFRVDQPGGVAETGQAPALESAASSIAPETKIVSNSAAGGRRLRIDTAESVEEIAATTSHRARTQGRAKDRYIDDAHESAMRGPHFEINAPKRSNLTSMTGQFLAYMGVLGLTIGTAMVIYGHFGGYAEYTPTGWLVTTVAQMLLFLGVINLVSGGIEQNNEDVSRRINTLGDQLLRIEQVTSEVLRGPKLSARLYDDPEAAAAAASSKETVGIDRE